MKLTLLLTALLATLAATVAGAVQTQTPKTPSSPAGSAYFEKNVRPVLAKNCYTCHGPKQQFAGLRLDSRAALLKGSERGAVIVPGKPEKSRLLTAIGYQDEIRMPPSGKLTSAEIANLTAWVKMGAPWGQEKPVVKRAQHWAFIPPREPTLPAVRDARWVKSPLDRFILARLEAKGLRPAPPADKRTLIRRATFDLIGLPPTNAEVTAFLADDSPDAFAKVVDRLLASPRYGERWGRHWLDVARYADSNGLDENLCYADAWRYRDYVIQAFNDDKPYDRFLTEQLAGDLLPKTGVEAQDNAQMIATGFLALGAKMLAEDDGVKMQMDIIDEQIDTVGKAFMGLTMGCARCHDHKFDPIKMTDYYGLAGIFHSTKTMENFRVVAVWNENVLASAETQRKLAAQEAEIAAAKRDLAARKSAALKRLVADARRRLGDYLLAGAELRRQQALTASLKPRLVKGVKPAAGVQVIEAETFARGNANKLFDGYGEGIGVILNGGKYPNVAEFDIAVPKAGAYQVDLRYAAAESRPLKLIINGRLVKEEAGGQVTGSWFPDTQKWFAEGVFALKAGRNTLRLERASYFPHIDKLLVAPSALPAGAVPRTAGQIAAAQGLNEAFVAPAAAYLARVAKQPPAALQAWFRAAPEQRAALARQLQQHLSAGDAEVTQIANDPKGPLALPKDSERYLPATTRTKLAGLKKRVKALEKAKPVLPRAMGVREGKIGDIKVHLRGSHLNLGAVAPRRFPAFLAGAQQPALDEQHSGRLALARWLTRADHPLTSRVMVNRIWRGHFGEGIVRSMDNFGRLGEKPTHPQLLDWLALHFIESGWSVKAMHRLIMLSNAYQMSTRYDVRAARLDPQNRLLWRMSRRRLDAEEIRDAILAVGGDLDLTMGGTLLRLKNRQYVTSTASRSFDAYSAPRRSVYLPVIRSSLYDVFQAFDFADPSTLHGARTSTTIAPQALFMMNSKLVLEQSRRWADRLLSSDVAGEPARVTLAYETAFARPPTRSEVSRALAFVSRVEARLAGAGADARAAHRRAWQSLCRVLIASSEFIYIE